ncbi:MAG: B12-binding domain-containing radical SAM protein [Candidatus Staskawiczbacteria bacterium]|jgi:hypothetical protein
MVANLKVQNQKSLWLRTWKWLVCAVFGVKPETNEQKRALFISPRFEDTYWSFRHALKFIGAKAAFPPLALMTLAAMLPKDWEIKLIDLNVRSHKGILVCAFEWLMSFLFGVKPKIKTAADLITAKEWKWASKGKVFVSAMIAQSKSTKEVLALCSKLGVKTVLGGPILETEEFCEKYSGATSYVLGEAEETFPKLLADMENGCAKSIYKPEPGQFPDLALSPIPLYGLVSPNDYGSGAISESRGCPGRCTFCSVAVLNGPKWRCKNPEQFLAELEAMYQAGFRGSVQVFSDNFIGNIKKAKLLLRKIIEWQKAHGHPFQFTIEASILTADDFELMDLMVGAGIRKVFLGLETNNPDCLAECGKRQNLNRDLVADVKKILRHGLIPMSGFMVGFDNDNPETFADDMIAFIQSTCVMAMVDTVQAQRGTPLYAKLEAEGRLKGELVSNTAHEPNFVPKMPLKTLVAGYEHILEAINSSRNLYERICNCFGEYNPSRRPKKGFNWRDTRAVVMSVFWLGIFGGKPAKYYWKTLFFAFSKDWRMLPEAFIFQIFGYHHRKSVWH